MRGLTVIDDAERLSAIANFPWEVLDYQRWLRGLPPAAVVSDGDYLFADQVARFELRDQDVLVTSGDLQVGDHQGALVLASARTGAEVKLTGLSRPAAVRILGALGAERTVAELKRVPGLEARDLGQLLRAAFGVLVFAPQAVQELETQVAGIEITRFPGSPYEIVRPYWENMISVRRHAARLPRALGSTEDTVRLLRELHVVALMGEDLGTFYRPSSRISSRGIAPGAFLRGCAETLDTPDGTLFLRGPRVNASLLGGELYHRALYALLQDPEAGDSVRQLEDAAGLGWGRIVTARAEGDERDAPWFCPPRPMQPAQLRSLVSSLADAFCAAERQDRARATACLARFHQRFIRLHPFRCANQCLAMNLVNLVLNASHGAGMPHQVLDHFALRLSEAAYQRLFATAVEQYLLTQAGPLERYQELGRRKRRAYAFIARVNSCRSVPQALELVASAPEEARLALFPV